MFFFQAQHFCLQNGKHTDIEIVAEATTGEQAIQMAMEKNPDVVLLDIRMPDSDGLAALREIRSQVPDTRMVMLSTSSAC